ncbi:MAG TPA: hypothetical protein PJ997_01460 [Candidatus Paceibacterota bacterium]|nr:hypothetical protein [Candidatus Paceibacterota bacterium]HMP18986.1 hypothetical protein [Candidatus Paceibacterota bacterium]HMP85239.1 hypothetical protein [Candidatus Paceibacterota bacterium]
MQQISFYLKKFFNLELKDSNLKKIIIESVKEVCNIELTTKDIDVQKKIVKINKVGVEKTEIFINKKKIQEKINLKLNSVDSFDKKII